MKRAAPVLPGLPSRPAALAELSEWERLAYAAIVAAAESRRHAPTASQLEGIVGCSPSMTVTVVHRLEAKGLIRVDRYQRGRKITVVATGKETAEVSNKTPHWRVANRPHGAPSVSDRAVKERNPSFHERLEAAAKAERQPLTEFMIDLMVAGWQVRERSIHGEGGSS